MSSCGGVCSSYDSLPECNLILNILQYTQLQQSVLPCLKIKHNKISLQINFAHLTKPPLHKVNLIYHKGRPESYLGMTNVQNSTEVKAPNNPSLHVSVLQPHKNESPHQKRLFFFFLSDERSLGFHNSPLQKQLCTVPHSALLTQHCNGESYVPAELNVNTAFKLQPRSSHAQPKMNCTKAERFCNAIPQVTQSKFKTATVITV